MLIYIYFHQQFYNRRNLFEQFRRVGNFFFLIQAVVQILMTAIPQVQEPPISPVTSCLPLAMIVIITMLKQGYEDFKRHKADRVVNQTKFYKLQEGKPTVIKSRSLGTDGSHRS